MIDTNPESSSQFPASPRPRGFALQFCWTIFFALVLAVGLFVIRHGQLPGLDQPLFVSASSQTPAPGTADYTAPSSGYYPTAPLAPPSARTNPAPPAYPLQPANPSSYPSSAANGNIAWRQQTCTNLIFETPVAVAPTAAPRQFPASVMEHLEYMHWWEGKISDRLDIAVGELRIDGAHTLSFADGVRGVERSMRNRGVTLEDAGFNPPSLFVSGCIARRISGTRVSSHGPIRADLLLIQRRRECMIIGIEYAEDLTNDVMRILNSVQVRGGPNG